MMSRASTPLAGTMAVASHRRRQTPLVPDVVAPAPKEPSGRRHNVGALTGPARLTVLVLLVLSVGALALAPALMPGSYSWIEHTTSEAAAQGVSGAWLARAGFVLLGSAVVVLAVVSRTRWPLAGTFLHGAFGVLMVTAAVFSARSWERAAPFDETEDLLHSIAASTMGLAFAAGVVIVLVARRSTGVGLLGPLAVVASMAIPLAMTAWPEGSGALQRLMFAIAYLWYGREALMSGPLPDGR
jgi:hypothetical protein